MSKKKTEVRKHGYPELLSGIVAVLEQGRRSAARSVNAVLTATYWLVGQRLVEREQQGAARAEYGSELLKRLSQDLQSRLGRGFSERNLEQMRQFYLQWGNPRTVSADSRAPARRGISQTPSAKLVPANPPAFPLSWSHYVRLLSVIDPAQRSHYEIQAIRGGWSVRQLDRQISTLSYQRSRTLTAPSGSTTSATSPEAEIKDPFVLEFLGLKDEYSEAEREESLIREMEQFLMELGNDFAFVARQKRLRVGTEWYRVDLLFFHRRLKALIVIQLITSFGPKALNPAGYPRGAPRPCGRVFARAQRVFPLTEAPESLQFRKEGESGDDPDNSASR